MTKNFTSFAKSLSVKLMLLMMAFGFANANAAVNDLGELELNKEYTLKDFQGYTATFTSDRDGTLVWETPTGTFITVYNDEAYTQETKNQHSYTDKGQVRQYKVKAGQTYYCYIDFVLNGGTFKLYFVEELKREKIAPEENTVFDITGKGYIELHYNMAVSIDTVLLSVDGKTLAGGDASVVGGIVGIMLKGENSHEIDVLELIRSGVLKAGDKMDFTFTVTSVINPSFKIDEKVTYICPEMPMQLVGDNTEGFALKSFWFPGDDGGKLVLTFDKNLWTPTEENKGPFVTISFGNVEAEDPGEFYHEEFYPTVEGNKLICDFTQKRRRIDDMVTVYEEKGADSVLIKVVNVLDEKGYFASSPGKGTLGTWSWRFPYQQIDCRITPEFSPKKVLQSDDTSIELWIGGYSNLRLNEDAGVLFSWTDAEGAEQSVKIAASDLVIEVEDGDATINVAVPDAVRSSAMFKMAFVGYTVADGMDHPIESEYTYEPVGINGVETADVVAVKCYDVNGTEVTSLVKGVNIVKKTLTDGTVETSKVLVK